MARTLLLALSLALLAPLSALADPIIPGQPDLTCRQSWRLHDSVGGGGPTGAFNGCPSDNHREWAQGGAFLISSSGDGVIRGGIACYGEVAHHSGGVTAVDVGGTGVVFAVAADYTDPSLPLTIGPDCGDGVIQPCSSASPIPCTPGDAMITCVASCGVPFPPGVDGAYLVIVLVGTATHIWA